ncbi:ExeM/NucH family extracellular endonuclease [Roseovarius sp. D22-M7]|uniref:ExeM/NucH family extracellular endonuclease n=1 Tax=Roseovarius sp. D22-M7 TaxID=3127116 RepID=UPI0030101628
MLDSTTSTTASLAGTVRINEIRPNPFGSDPATQQLELKGMPGAAFSGFLFSLESDFASTIPPVGNVIDTREAVSGTFDADGLLLATIPDIENPSFTLVLTDDTATATVGDTIDPAAPASLGVIHDAIGVADAATDPVSGAALGGTDIAYTGDEPKLVFRDGTTGDLYAVNDPDNGEVSDANGNTFAPADFDIDPLAGDTFGSVNPSLTGGGGGTDPTPAPALISAVQGAGDISPLNGQVVTVEAVVVGDFQDGDADTTRDLRGFYLQEEDADADGDAATSEGVFVFDGDTPVVDVNIGDVVRVTGTVTEFFGETQIGDVTEVTVVSQNATLPTAASISLPASATTLDQDGDVQPDLESFEGMLVSFEETLTVNEMFQLDRFNEIKLVQGDRPEQFTQSNAPDVAGFAQHLLDVGARQITYDDGLNQQNAAIDNLDGFAPFSDVNAVSMGDTVDNLTGVLNYQWAGNGASGATWRVRSTEDGENTFDDTNPRPTEPADVGGTLKVAAFNVLNYFTTLDTGGTTANGSGPRGADSPVEFERQTDKLVTALLEIDADIVGLVELENDFLSGTSGNAIQSLVGSLNDVAGAGTYDWVDPGRQFVDVSDAISQGAIYKTGSVSVKAGTNVAILDDANLPPSLAGETIFDGPSTNRAPLAVTFEETATGEAFTIAVNHFKSKGSIFDEPGNTAAGDGAGNNNQIRLEAAQALNDWLATDPTGSGDGDFMVLGDLNAYAEEDPITFLEAAGYTDLVEAFEPNGSSFVFDGQTGTLDYAMANASLLGQVTGATAWNINADEADALDYNLDFGRDPGYFDGDTPFRSSDHDPIIVGLDLETTTPEPDVFTLELLHITDQEASTGNIGDFARASGVLNALEAQDLGNDGLADNTVRLSAGDAIIPGVFYDAAEAVFGSGGIADIQLVNEMGFQAVALGNHEFDKGTAELAALIDGSAPGDFSALSGTALDGLDFAGAAFPYLSANLEFSTDANLAPLEVAGGQAPQANAVTSSTVLDVNGEKLGVIGAVTPNLASISSTGDVGISPLWSGGTPTAAELDALAAEIQAEVDALLSATPGLNKMVLLAHMQDITIEQGLATRLENVDIIVGGGSNTRLFDETDDIRPGDSNQGSYPQFFENAGGTQTALVNTDGSYKYVGRLVLDFDADGNIIAESYDAAVSGAYATDATGLANVSGEALIDPEVQAITDAIQGEILASEGNVFGVSNVFLNGNRSGTDSPTDPDGVRTQETNLGNLTADANLAAAQAADGDVMVSIKNGGGIRASIGETVVPAGGSDFVRQPNGEILDADGNVVKPEGGISQNDIQTTLAFNNTLSLLTLTHQNLIEVLEHGLEGLPGVAGGFPQVAGVQFSFDDDQPAGSRIVNAAITDDAGNDIAVLMQDGEIVTPDAEVRVVTLNFLADGGDGYPFPMGADADRVDLADLDGDGIPDDGREGTATFAEDGTEQDALAEYVAANFGDAASAYDEMDVGRDQDTRIQNLDFREDTVIDEPEMVRVEGTSGRDRLTGTDADEIIISGEGRYDTQTGGLGADVFVFGAETQNGVRERDIITDYEVGIDVIGLAEGTTVADIRGTSSSVVVYFDDPSGAQDAVYVRGDGVTAENLTFETFDTLAFA